MDANLVRPAGAGLDTAKGKSPKPFDDLVVAACVLTVGLIFGCDHLDAVVRVMADPALYVVAVSVGRAGGKSDVLLEYLPRFTLITHVAMGPFLFGHSDNATAATVEPVN